MQRYSRKLVTKNFASLGHTFSMKHKSTQAEELSESRKSTKASFDFSDPLDLRSQLTEDERLIMDTSRSFCQSNLMPRVLTANREERFDREIMNEFGELGFNISSSDLILVETVITSHLFLE